MARYFFVFELVRGLDSDVKQDEVGDVEELK